MMCIALWVFKWNEFIILWLWKLWKEIKKRKLSLLPEFACQIPNEKRLQLIFMSRRWSEKVRVPRVSYKLKKGVFFAAAIKPTQTLF